MTAREKLIMAKANIQKHLDEFISEREAMLQRKATMIELALMDDLVRSCEKRLSEVNDYLQIGEK